MNVGLLGVERHTVSARDRDEPALGAGAVFVSACWICGRAGSAGDGEFYRGPGCLCDAHAYVGIVGDFLLDEEGLGYVLGRGAAAAQPVTLPVGSGEEFFKIPLGKHEGLVGSLATRKALIIEFGEEIQVVVGESKPLPSYLGLSAEGQHAFELGRADKLVFVGFARVGGRVV